MGRNSGFVGCSMPQSDPDDDSRGIVAIEADRGEHLLTESAKRSQWAFKNGFSGR